MRRPPETGPTNDLRVRSSNLSPWNNYVALSRLGRPLTARQVALSGAWVGAVCVPGWRRVADRVRVPLGGQPPALRASGSSEIGGRRYGPRPAPCARPVWWLLPCGRCCCTVAAVSETHSGEAAGAGAWEPHMKSHVGWSTIRNRVPPPTAPVFPCPAWLIRAISCEPMALWKRKQTRLDLGGRPTRHRRQWT